MKQKKIHKIWIWMTISGKKKFTNYNELRKFKRI